MVLKYGMDDVLVPIDKAGRVVLPKQMRDELAINPGDQLKASIHGNEITLCLTRETSGFFKRGRALVFSSGEADLLDISTVEAIRAGESENLLNRQLEGFPSQTRK
jgi:AbrB family looped-hinge helix DNA binding protein